MLIPDIDAFEERAAIGQFEGQLTRERAEDLTARAKGFRGADHYWQELADYVVKWQVPE
ncbi:hypothetical protein [Litoreibacter janthinus]|uniref:Uncharacterized protein n=1 Tax=Litoreibacter janthinus TaxID=670154 RepID=A0A1I6FRM2_9RHOB|nr:hypothetical protein [Litoreibacter janthinus]SFR32605.1 hypothetical protein SAMN04488002_0166 [Litoreibacter janthinus]